MAKIVERDWVVEANDRLVVNDDEAVKSIVDRLPATPLLKVSDVACALGVGETQVLNWIELGFFKVMSIGIGEVRPHNRIVRVSFIDWVKRSIR